MKVTKYNNNRRTSRAAFSFPFREDLISALDRLQMELPKETLPEALRSQEYGCNFHLGLEEN